MSRSRSKGGGGGGIPTAIGQSAMHQIIASQKKRVSESEALELVAKIEAACLRFDKKGNGKLNLDDLYNVIKLQNKLGCSKADLARMMDDVGRDRDGRVSIKVRECRLMRDSHPCHILN